jgi:hypothetical protein
MMRSTDGLNYTKSALLSGEPYNVQISPFDQTRAIFAAHDVDHFYESTDSGVTWTDHGSVSGLGVSAHAFHLDNSDTVMMFGSDSNNSYRGVKSSGTWTWTRITDLDGAGHFHGSCQMYRDPANGYLYTGSEGGNPGIWRSTNNGLNWTKVYGTDGVTTITATPTTLYAQRAAPTTGTSSPKIATALRSAGASWTGQSDPSGMTNGAKKLVVTQNPAGQYVVVGANWDAGIWRYVEAIT